MEIKYIPYKELDKKKWDDCIDQCINANIYAQSFYLDNMAGKWDALILDNYDAVMPLPYRKKFSITYLYPPAFTQQLGVFFRSVPSDEVYGLFISEMVKHFRYADIMFNHYNINMPQPVPGELKNNFILDLNDTYQNIAAGFAKDFKKNLRRSAGFSLTYTPTGQTDLIIDLYKDLYGKRLSSIKEKDFISLKKICTLLKSRGNIYTAKITDTHDKILAAIILFRYKNRLYNIISCITEEGRKKEANFFLYDSVIHDHSEKEFLLDLEGSDTPGIADFYRKLNPVNQPYLHIKFNRLPSVIRLIKP